MNITLFDAAQSVREALAVIDPETGEITEDYRKSRDLFERKGGACVAYAYEESATIEAAEKLLKSMAANLAARKARLDRFRDYLADCMRAAEVTQIAADGLVRATLYRERDISVEIDKGVEFPAALCADPKPPEPSKTKIRAAIDAGEAVAGARIVRRDRLTIK